jgi:hypothetical protein
MLIPMLSHQTSLCPECIHSVLWKFVMDNAACSSNGNSNAADKSQIITWFSKISSSTLAAFTTILDVLGRPVRSWTCMFIQSFSNTLHHFLICCTLIMPSSYTSINWQSISMGETCFPHKNQIPLQTSSQHHVSIVTATAHQPRTYPLSIWLIWLLCQLVSCYPYQVLQPKQTQKLQAREPYSLNIPHKFHQNSVCNVRHETCSVTANIS